MFELAAAYIEDIDTLNVTEFYPFDDSMLGVLQGAFSLNVPAHEQVSVSLKLKPRMSNNQYSVLHLWW